MNSKNLSESDIVRIASEAAAQIGAEAGIAIYEAERKKQKRKQRDRRLRDTRRLFSHYREIKAHAEDAIADMADMDEEDYDFFKNLMEEDRSIDVQTIITSKVRSAIMLAHIDAMLLKYEQIAMASKRPEEKRRFKALEAIYISDDAQTVQDIAAQENVHERTVYKDLDVAYARMSALLFGVQWVERTDE